MTLREDADRPGFAVDVSDEERAEGPTRPAAMGSPPAAATVVRDREEPVRKRPLRRVILLAVLAAALGGGGYAAWQWWTVGRFFVSTDDAYVQADISVLAAKVSGYLESVPVVNG
ncbi:MAG: HlyD family secretion protein, partial [Parafilimonas terrae]|nr:HlyD family secretion protein [Parafilimonas terrae]